LLLLGDVKFELAGFDAQRAEIRLNTVQFRLERKELCAIRIIIHASQGIDRLAGSVNR
jgi:hypothetical protein